MDCILVSAEPFHSTAGMKVRLWNIYFKCHSKELLGGQMTWKRKKFQYMCFSFCLFVFALAYLLESVHTKHKLRIEMRL